MTEQAVIYARVSTEEQADPDKTSLAQQRERCLGYCQAMGWEVVEVYEDAGVSGTIEPRLRPALGRLLEDAEAHRIEHVVFLKVDRLARSLRGLLNLSHQLDGLRVGLASVVEQFDTGTPTGSLFFNLLGAFAEFESAQINERMSSGRKGAVQQGKYLASTVPFGYIRENGILKEHPQQADVVRQMFHWARQGLGVKAIASRLEERGVGLPNPSKRRSHWGWHFTTVYKILTSPRNVGLATYGGEPMLCPALVDEETFNVVQAEIKRHKRDSRRNTKRDYVLQHLIYCRHCGGRYMGKWVGNGAIYLCRRRTTYGSRAGHEGVRWRWRAEELEEPVKRHVLQLLSDREYLVNVRLYLEETERRFGEQRDQEAQLQARLNELERQEHRALKGWEKGFYKDERQLQDHLTAIRIEQAEVGARRESIGVQPSEELSKARKTSILSQHIWFKYAAPIIEGYRRGLPFAREAREGWVERALTGLARTSQIEWADYDEETGKTHEVLIPLDQWWRELVTNLVSRIWVEDDGSVTIEGTITPTNGVAESKVSNSPRLR